MCIKSPYFFIQLSFLSLRKKNSNSSQFLHLLQKKMLALYLVVLIFSAFSYGIYFIYTYIYIYISFGLFLNSFILILGQAAQCEKNPCQNKGVCSINAMGGEACICQSGFTGHFCEIKMDLPDAPCQPNPCKNTGVCSLTGSKAGYKCSCQCRLL